MALAAYDIDKTKAAMKQAAQTIKELNDKAAAKDYFATAEKFMDLAKIFKGTENDSPPACDQALWARIHDGIVKAAFKGIGACGQKDDAAIKKAIADIVKLRDEGHKKFITKK
jgi:hypothetical protein